jgi:type VI secretion system protein VasG
MKLTADPETTPNHDGLMRALKPELDKTFKPAFLGRTVIIPFFPVRDEVLRTIIRLKLGKVQRRLRETHRVELQAGDAVIDAIAARCTEVESGARNVDNILTNTVLPAVSRLLLQSMVAGNRHEAIRVTVDERGNFGYATVEQGGVAAQAEPVAAVSA